MERIAAIVLTPRPAARGLVVRAAGLLLVAVVLTGCDKCGNRLTLNAPSIPKACGANADPAG